jgi:cytochrome c553
MTNQAKSRSTMAHFRDAQGRDYLFVSGSSKTGADFSTNVPPGLVALQVVSSAQKPAYLRIAARELTQVFANPSSPVVSSRAGRNAIVWVLDPAAPRSQDLFQPGSPHARLYAFDATTLDLLWKSGDELFTTGKYNEPTVVDGLVLVGTDRLQALGLGGKTIGRPSASPAGPAAAPITRSALEEGKAVFRNRCSACHGTGLGGAPSIETLEKLHPSVIVAALTEGKMKPMATGLTREQMRSVAVFITQHGEQTWSAP